MRRLSFLLFFSLCLTAMSVSATTWHVAVSGSDQSGGGSEGNPFATIQYAIDAAVSDDTVMVYQGLFTGNINFLGKGISVKSIDGPLQTIIEPSYPGTPVVQFASGESSNSVLNGLTIRNSVNAPAIMIIGSTPTIKYCEIYSCTNSGNGGAIQCIGGSSATIESNRFYSNSAESGGAIYCSGSNPVITGNVFASNSAGIGGALTIDNNSSPDIAYNLFVYNESNQDGGAVANVSMFGPPLLIKYCTFFQNNASGNGGAAYSAMLPLIVERSIFWQDAATGSGSEVSGDPPASAIVSYSDVYGGWTGPGVGNCDVDPEFCDTENGDFHLRDGSYLAVYPLNNNNPIGAYGPGCLDLGCDDYDEDGVCDDIDNCPYMANSDQADSDADGFGNLCDNCPEVANSDQSDSDGDGFGDVCDNCVNVANSDQADSDADGFGDLCDNCPEVANSDQADSDGDGFGDGFGDVCDNCVDVANSDQADSDADGFGDLCDNCPEVANTDQADSDGDGFGDVCDNCVDVANEDQADADADGFGDQCDNCPDAANSDQADSDGDGVGDVCDNCVDVANEDQADADADGFGNLCDNCPEVANSDQSDSDGDGFGDVCDNCVNVATEDQADADADGFGNLCDNCPEVANSDQSDSDGDGFGDVCDNCVNVANSDQADSDADGFGDLCDNCPEVANSDQSDSDGDGVGDVCDNCIETDNPAQADSDRDGVGDKCDNCPEVANTDQADSDGDGVGDACAGEAGIIFGFVMDSESSIEGVRVDLFDSQDHPISVAWTNEKGRYQFDNLPIGSYFVCIWPPFGYSAAGTLDKVQLNNDVVEVDFYLTPVHGRCMWRGRGYWKYQARCHVYGYGHPHESHEAMCDYLERIRIYFNSNTEYPIFGFIVDADADCDQRMEDLLKVLRPKPWWNVWARARANFAVLLLNIVSGRIPPWASVYSHGTGKTMSGEDNDITVSQAVVYSEQLLTDGDSSNDEMVYIIDSLVNNDEPVPSGLIDPMTPNVDFLGTLSTDEDEDPLIPSEFSVSQNYPNPFNPRTRIAYNLNSSGQVQIIVYNALGQPVKILVNEYQTAGLYSVEWDGTNAENNSVSSGVYFYSVTSGEQTQTRKMLLIK